MTLQSFKTPRQIIMEKFHEVLHAVAEEDHVTVDEIMSSSTYREHTRARRKAMQRMRTELPQVTLKRIAELFNHEHTAVSHMLGNTAKAKANPPKPEKPVEMVRCACGCGFFRTKKTKGRLRRYINGHQPNLATHPHMVDKIKVDA